MDRELLVTLKKQKKAYTPVQTELEEGPELDSARKSLLESKVSEFYGNSTAPLWKQQNQTWDLLESVRTRHGKVEPQEIVSVLDLLDAQKIVTIEVADKCDFASYIITAECEVETQRISIMESLCETVEILNEAVSF